MSTLLDQETVVLEGLEFEPECEDQRDPAHAATHVAQCRACGGTLLLCEGHLAYLRWRFRWSGIKHVPCGKLASSFDALFTWRSL